MTNAANASDLIRLVEQADTSTQLVAAVRALADAHLEAGIPTLIAVLGYNNPSAAAEAVRGLLELGPVAVPLLIERIDEYNYGARAYSFRVLSAIADPRAFEVLRQAAETDFAPSVRRAAAKGLGSLHWSELSPQQRHPVQEQALKTLLLLSQDPDWAIRYAAVVGLQGLVAPESVAQPNVVSQVLARFAEMTQNDPDLVIRARVDMAQQQLQGSNTQLSAVR